ncbi:MAG: type II toxin-antitoxin system VapC family toxin [Bacteroidota bacterium]
MGHGYLIDSNAIIYFCNGKLPVNGKSFLSSIELKISIISNIELFAAKNISEKEQLILKKIVAIANVYPVSAELVEATIHIRQQYRTKLPDAIIAATCLTYDLVLVTGNVNDFKSISGLKIVNPLTM